MPPAACYLPAPGKTTEKTTAIDNDLVFVEASIPGKLKKFRASVRFRNATHKRTQHAHRGKWKNPAVQGGELRDLIAEWRSG